MIIQIIRGTPVWVWGLLAVLLAPGLSQSMPRRVSARRVMVLPALMLALSVGGVVSSFPLYGNVVGGNGIFAGMTVFTSDLITP